ncbi:phosphonate ABC transporter, permease protein PhnE [Falsibacillus albus]|uniref:Phosphonate ABC transporter, permease protein PhnE n=1 Tax=Falsibacillus albus TaxID=2478915 RepID=A0A3L7JUV7_9BACI|nr:phosphonate ABC transporter, permease protein PhnE [Falsibacillus albus]RLQ94085.1 phosphonate ABC transporter, permease protein PhnE [Falsibacillus albus]
MTQDQLKKPARTKFWTTVILLIVLFWVSAKSTDATFSELFDGLPQIGILLAKMFPPDWSYFSYVIDPMLETIRMALLGATFGAILAIPVALLSASNVFESSWIVLPSRFILNLIRTVPDLLLAAIFVAIFGLGPLPGIWALTIFSLGIIAKLTYESIEAIDRGPLEAMTAVGANKLQWIFFGVIPQVLPQFLSYSIYTFEINVRAAAVLGLVGAGGIGIYYERTLGFFQYDRVASIIIFTLVVVLLIDYISTKIREKLI